MRRRQVGAALASSALTPRARRLFGETLALPLPTPSERRALLRRALARHGVASDATQVEALADQCHGLLACDVEQLVRAALALAWRNGDARATMQHVDAARRALVPSVLGAVAVHALTDSRLDAAAVAVAGLDVERLLLQETLMSLGGARRRALRRLGADPPRGVLLYGAPGCGKVRACVRRLCRRRF